MRRPADLFATAYTKPKLMRNSGENRRSKTGRWRSDADRAVFLAGYQQGSDRSVTVASLPTGPELVGFRNGVADGANARRADQPFTLRSGLLRLSHGQSRDGLEQGSEYIRAYANGYQYGYYSDYGHYRDDETLQSELAGHIEIISSDRP